MTGTRPLSAGQESLWLLYQLAPDSAAYNDVGAVWMSPAPDAPALERALRETVRRHDLMRSVFVEEDGLPQRRVREPETVRLDVRDTPDLDEATLERVVAAEAKLPFDLTGDGPLRVVLFRRNDDAVLLVAAHHIATDATSQAVLWRDLFTAYEAVVAGSDPKWTALRWSYDDHVARERELLGSPRRAELEAHWRDVCASGVAAELLTDRPRTATRSFAGASTTRRLPDDLVRRLRHTAACAGLTPFAYLLGAFQVLLYRRTGQADFRIGCPMSVRRTLKMRDLVGYFVNPVVLRSRFTAGTTMADAVASAAEQIKQASAHATYPLALLSTGSEPLFRIAFTMVSTAAVSPLTEALGSGEEVEHNGFRVRLLDLPNLEGQFDLNVEITHRRDAITAVFRYDADLFDAATVDRLVDTYLRLVEASVSSPGVAVRRLSLVDKAELRGLTAIGMG